MHAPGSASGGGGTLVGTVSGIFEAAITAAFPALSSGLEKEKWLKINATTDAKFGGEWDKNAARCKPRPWGRQSQRMRGAA